MNNLFKKLAFMMALTMTVATAAPAAQASAAATPVLNTTSKKLYMETDVATGKYSNTFTLKVWNKGDYRVTFTSSNPEVATVSKWWGTVKSVAPGEATITATVTNKTTGKVVKTLTSKVWVKRNATDIGFSTASAAKFDEALKIGDKAKLNVFRTDADGNTSWSQADKTKVTDYIVWTSSDEKVATVDKWGTVTAVGAGEATITAKSVQTEAKNVATTEEETIKVTVKAEGITAVKQTTSKKVELTVGSDLSEVIKAETLVVAPTTASVQTPIVKSVKWNDEKTVATVEFYTELTDKEAYAISVTGNDDLKAEFVASVGEVAAITIANPATALVNTATEIKYTLTDANGVEVSAKTGANVTFEVIENDLNGYTADGKVTVFEKGKTVVIQAVYHTNTYTTEGEEVVIKSNAFVVTGVDKVDATLKTVKYTISKNTVTDWDNYTENLRVTMEDNTQKIQAYVKDSLDTEYKTADAFKFESMDETKVIVNEDGTLFPVAEGTAYVKVTVKDTEKSFLVKVTVAGKVKVASLALDTYNATLSHVAAADDEVKVKLTVKDQYGNDYKFATSDVTVKLSDGTELTNGEYSIDGDTITFVGKNFAVDANKTKNFAVKVTIGDYSRVITLTVKDSTLDATNYKLVVSDTSFDMALTNKNDEAKAITFDYYAYDKNGVKVDKLTAGTDYTVEVKNSKNEVIALTADSKLEVLKEVAGSNELKKNVKAGTYTVTITKDGKVATKANFVITDTQVAPVLKQNVTTVATSGTALNTLLDAFAVSTSNKNSSIEIVDFEYTLVGATAVTGSAVEKASDFAAGDKVVITKVIVKETFDSGKFFNHEIKTSKTVTIK